MITIKYLLLINIHFATCLTPQQPLSTWTLPDIPSSSIHRVTQVFSSSVAASYYDNEDNVDGQMNPPSSRGTGAPDFDTLGRDEAFKRRKRKIVIEQSTVGGGKTNIYDVTLPVTKTVSADSTTNELLGLQLREINERGEISDSSLDLDLLRYQSVAEEVFRDMDMDVVMPDNVKEEGPIGSVQLLNLPVNFVLDPDMKGVIVSGVVRGSMSWNAGVRSGDFLISTSATLGDKMWPKSTLEGVRSAVSSRKIMSSSTMKLQFKRAGFSIKSADEVVSEFEISLMRPLGVNIADDEDGYVTVTGFTEGASFLVRERLMLGDRIVAMESSIGGNMWPISNVNGAVSACTSRLPGQPVKIRFERVVTDAGTIGIENGAMGKDTKATKISGVETSIRKTDTKLLGRCCDVLKRYMAVYDPNASKAAAIPAIVADRVLETLADASATLDPKTLSLIMNSYLLCSQPENAIRAFEAAVGISADGSNRKTDVTIEGKREGSKIIADITAIDLYTGTDIICSHAKMGNFFSARRVLAAMESDGLVLDGIRSMTWPGKIKVDTKSYNNVLAAAAGNANDEEGLKIAKDVFSAMSEPVLFTTTATPKKNLVSYNIMIEAYARIGNRSDAFAVYNSLRDAGLKPDKISITGLIKAVVTDNDIETARILLRDMKTNNIKPDVVTYNTMIRTLCEKLQWYEAKELVADMETCGIDPNQKTYGLLMNGLMKAKQPQACLTLFESACADPRTVSLTENVQLYTTAVTAAASLADYERALDLVSRMTFAGIQPNTKTYTVLMGACLSGGRADFAIDVFKKIKRPDGYALSKGVQAYCANKDFTSALKIIESQNDKQGLMTGKQVMSNYYHFIHSALESGNYTAATNIMTNLLDNGYIPSKKMLQTIVSSLSLNKKRNLERDVRPGSTPEECDQFKYLLSVFDSLARRNLPCDAMFYSAFLYEGARQGGLQKRISSLIKDARINISQPTNNLCLYEDEDDDTCIVKKQITWTELFSNYSLYKGEIDEISMPTIQLRVSEKEIRQVVTAEKVLSFGARRNR